MRNHRLSSASGPYQRIFLEQWVGSKILPNQRAEKSHHQTMLPLQLPKKSRQQLPMANHRSFEVSKFFVGAPSIHRYLTAESSSMRRSDQTDTVSNPDHSAASEAEEMPLNANCVACIATEVKDVNCWSCGAERKSTHDLFCRNCGSIQPPGPSSFFELLGVGPPDFNVDVKKIEARYKNLMRQLHPDKYMQQCARQRDFSSVRHKCHLNKHKFCV